MRNHSEFHLDFFTLIEGKENTGRCCVKGCRHTLNPKDRSHSGRFCRRCRDRRYKATNPIAYAWDKLKWSARKRKIPFKLTKAQFITFCLATGYAEGKGKTASSLSVDRIDASRGYEFDNIQILTLADNSRKAHVDAKLAKKYGPRSTPEPERKVDADGFYIFDEPDLACVGESPFG